MRRRRPRLDFASRMTALDRGFDAGSGAFLEAWLRCEVGLPETRTED